jgi:hypothetical protein
MGSTIGQPHPASTKPSVIIKPKKKRRRTLGGTRGDSSGAIKDENSVL